MGGHNIYIPRSTNPCLTSLQNGLLSYYKFEETSGNFLDSKGSNHLTVNGSVTRGETGKLGNCVYFDGSSYNNYLSGSHPCTGLTEFSIAGWVKLDDDTNDYPYFMGGNNTDTEFTLTFNGNFISNLLLAGYKATSNAQYSVLSVSISSDTWYMVALRGYVDSNRLNLQPIVNNDFSETYRSPTESDLTQVADTLYFGKGTINHTNYIIKGWIDNMAFWNRQLTDCELRAFYNSGNGVIL